MDRYVTHCPCGCRYCSGTINSHPRQLAAMGRLENGMPVLILLQKKQVHVFATGSLCFSMASDPAKSLVVIFDLLLINAIHNIIFNRLMSNDNLLRK